MGKKQDQKPQKKMGRPPKEIKWSTFEYLCSIQCTMTEIAGAFQCDVDTIQRHVQKQYGQTFAAVYKVFAANGLASLRRAQWDEAVRNRDTTLLKHLSKNHLGMSDKITSEVNLTGEIQTSNVSLDDVKKVMSDPEAKKLSRQLAMRIVELDKKEREDENS